MDEVLVVLWLMVDLSQEIPIYQAITTIKPRDRRQAHIMSVQTPVTIIPILQI